MKSLSLFSGAGGMDIGVRQAGFDVLACIEIDPNCIATLKADVERHSYLTKVLQQDIRTVDPIQLMNTLELEKGELDLLFGGPPCQAFSAIGKQNSLSDERGMLLFEMTRFGAAFRPRFIMIEQVTGLLSARDETGRKSGVFERLISQLKDELGYQVAWQPIVAADYGVPQLRERIFIVAWQDSELDFEFPAPTHRPTDVIDLFNAHLPKYITVGDVLCDLPAPADKDKTNLPIDSHMDVTTDGDRRRIHGVPEGDWLARQLHLPAEQLCNLTRKDTTKFRRMHRAQPSLTLRCGEIFFHPLEDRILTPREYMRLHGYPDEYILKGPIRSRSGRVRELDQHRQVANSVPPPVARVITSQIAKALECQHKSMNSLVIA